MRTYNRRLKRQARRLRATMTDSEQRLWERLRGKQLLGVQFYRQKPLGNYIVDFYAPKAGLVVEVDGSQHLQAQHAARDTQLDAYLRRQGLRVLRFTNVEVLGALYGVLEVIFRAVENGLASGKSQENPPIPPFRKGGRREDLDKGGKGR